MYASMRVLMPQVVCNCRNDIAVFIVWYAVDIVVLIERDPVVAALLIFLAEEGFAPVVDRKCSPGRVRSPANR